MAQRKTIIQTQFVSVVSKVISDDIFNKRYLKIKNVGKIKNVKKRKKRAVNKKRKKRFFYIYASKLLRGGEGSEGEGTGWGGMWSPKNP